MQYKQTGTYARNIIAGLVVAGSLAFSGLEARAQSRSAANLWRQSQAGSTAGRDDALKSGNMKKAMERQQAASSAGFIASMMETWASDEQAAIDKKNKEQLDQMQRNQEEILENQRNNGSNLNYGSKPKDPQQANERLAQIQTRLNEINKELLPAYQERVLECLKQIQTIYKSNPDNIQDLRATYIKTKEIEVERNKTLNELKERGITQVNNRKLVEYENEAKKMHGILEEQAEIMNINPKNIK